MIEFDDKLSEFEDIMTFKLEQQLLELVKKFEGNRNIEEWKRHVRSLQTYCRSGDKAVNKSFRISCDEKGSSSKDPSLGTSEGNSKVRREKDPEEAPASVAPSTTVKGSAFKAFKSFRVTSSLKIKRDSRALRRS